MPNTPLDAVLRYLRRMALPVKEGCTDGRLLELFVHQGDEAAFTSLMSRHGPMVLGVCRRHLGNDADAEDAFQATFLVLVRKAASIRTRETVANWLYGVAHRTALEARRASARRRAKEAKATPSGEASDGAMANELREVLDQVLGRLPARYREIIVLCDLEGEGRKEVARRLGCPEGTVASRLARARSRLAGRLARRGLAVSGVALAAALSQQSASACVPLSLAASTVKAAKLLAAGATAGVVSAQVAALTTGVVKKMLLSKLKIAAVVLLVGVVVTAATACLVYRNHTGVQVVDEPKGETKPAAFPPVIRRPKLRSKLEVGGGVSTMAFSRDSKTLATAIDDGTITLWDVASGTKTATLPTPPGGSLCVVFSPDGKILAFSGAEDRKIRFWDLDSGKVMATLVGHFNPRHQIHSLAFSPDGKTLASADDDTFILWDVPSRSLIADEGHFHGQVPFGGEVNAVAFSPDGKTLASGHADCFNFWDIESRKQIAFLDADPGGSHNPPDVWSLAFSPDGKTLAAGYDHGGGAKLRDWRGGKTIATFPHGGPDVAFSVDGTMLAMGGDKAAKLWTVGASEDTAMSLSPGSVAFSPDGKTLASGGGTICFWDLQSTAEPDK